LLFDLNKLQKTEQYFMK